MINLRTKDPRLIRVMDLTPDEEVHVTCRCGRIVVLTSRSLGRLHRIPSDTLIYDLQYRLHCRHCNARDGFVIYIEDMSERSNSFRVRKVAQVVPYIPEDS